MFCYVVFLATFLYAVGFLGNFGVPKSIDSGRQVPLGYALAINLALLGLFAVQHSVMARPRFKKTWTKIVPKVAERSTYVLFSSLALIVLFWGWQPMGGVVWSMKNAYIRYSIEALYAIGWLMVLVATFLINHFDLFGLRQVWFHLKGKSYEPLVFRTPGPYRLVRHPLYVGWLMVFWSAPVMTVAHFVFAVMTTTYILIAIQLEERDLMRFHHEYVEYKKRVPMLIPIGPRRKH
jgi:protein-S-isoprenylcysteine O-methyltransferase Ste14